MSMAKAKSSSHQIRVNLGERSYDILIGPSLLEKAGDLIKPFAKGRPVTLITDRNVARLHLPAIAHSLARSGLDHRSITIEPGEESKSFAGLSALCDNLLSLGIERQSLLIALGGGVVGDLVGFAAAIVLRGLDFIQIPTTLLAQVDSSVGGKTGINTKLGKNLIGSFHQPKLVLADISTLRSLTLRELRAGYAEIVKYGLINDVTFFDWCEQHGQALLAGDEEARSAAILHSCRAKAHIAGSDERESGDRALLNLGHTFGHALEAECGYDGRLLHGEAVAIGMVMAFDFSAKLDLCAQADADRLRAHFKNIGLPVSPLEIVGQKWSAKALIGHMEKDKKIRDGRIAFVLAHGIGKAFTPAFADRADLLAFLKKVIA